MSAYLIEEVNGLATAEVLRYLNALDSVHFPPLQDRHLAQGYWWLARGEQRRIVGFAGMVPMHPFDKVGYLKRAWVDPAARGNGLQLKFMRARETKAWSLRWHTLVSECANNPHSENNFIKAGFQRCEPEQVWGAPDSVYFVKRYLAP